eukprot:728289-Prorocentrum_lima.AAC.1
MAMVHGKLSYNGNLLWWYLPDSVPGTPVALDRQELRIRQQHEVLWYTHYNIDEYIPHNNLFHDVIITGFLKLIRDKILCQTFSWRKRDS